MKIALSGYGKMGKIVEKVATDRGHEISCRLDSKNTTAWNEITASNTDVVIDFSKPGSAIENIGNCLERNLPLVIGTTGWYDQLDVIRKRVETNGNSLLYASNFSIGVNLFFELNVFLARMMADHDDYRPHVEETHHVHKADAPSGTAITLANDLIGQNSKLNKWVLGESDAADELPVIAHRIDEVPGTHEIIYRSEIDGISIRHEARSRAGFALGAVIAAEWLPGKKGFFNISDVLKVNLR